MLNNFIYAQSKAMFEERLHEIPNDAIVFIEDTREIWTHGHYFDGSTLDPSIIPNLQMEVAELGANVANTYTKTESDARFTMLSITHSELVTLRDNGQLIPGQQYRITDYVTTTAQSGTISAGHQFDIIVTADSENTLNEKARAIQHEDDVYFGDADLNAWEIWYCLDNDTNRFSWAKSNKNEVQAGIIKPISGVSGSGTYKYDIPISRVVFNNNSYILTIGTRTMINGGPPVYVTLTDDYTLVVEDSSVYLPANPIYVYGISHAGKGVIYRMIDEFGNDCPYDFKNIMFIHPNDSITYPGYYYTFTTLANGDINDHSVNNKIYCNNNVINPRFYSLQTQLNSIVFINTSINANCYNNSFKNKCYSNSFGSGCYGNVFGTNCYDNEFGNMCVSNVFGDDCHGNIILDGFANNSFGDYCISNRFGNNCEYNSFGHTCKRNSLGEFCDVNSFGNGCEDIHFAANCRGNSFGNYCSTIKFVSSGTTYRGFVSYVHVDDGVQAVTVQNSNVSGSLRNIHIHNGVIGTVNINVTDSARQINVYRINYSSSAGVNAVDYGEWYKHVTTSGNINVYDRHIICDNTSAITLTLPTGFPGAEFYLHKRAAQSVSVTLTSTGGQYISEGHSTKNTETRATSVTMTSLGTSKVIWDPSASEWLRIYMG